MEKSQPTRHNDDFTKTLQELEKSEDVGVLAAISDEKLLFYIAKNTSKEAIRHAVTAKLVNQRLIAEMVKIEALNTDSLQGVNGRRSDSSQMSDLVRKGTYSRIVKAVCAQGGHDWTRAAGKCRTCKSCGIQEHVGDVVIKEENGKRQTLCSICGRPC